MRHDDLQELTLTAAFILFMAGFVMGGTILLLAGL
jgi:hypothetical protein